MRRVESAWTVNDKREIGWLLVGTGCCCEVELATVVVVADVAVAGGGEEEETGGSGGMNPSGPV